MAILTSQKIRVTKKFTFDMAHALFGYDGPCKNIHGHTYHLYVTLIGEIQNENGNSKNGMVMDFTDLKQIVKKHIIDFFDHSLVLNYESPQAKLIESNFVFEKVIYTDYQPSCENLIVDFLERIKNELPKTVSINSLRLEETPTSYAEWFAEDNN